MKLPQFLKEIEANERPPVDPPPYIMYVPPSGSAVECPSLETATAVATNYAARGPGKVVAVYALTGFAFVPIKPPDFTPRTPESAAKMIDESAPAEEGKSAN